MRASAIVQADIRVIHVVNVAGGRVNIGITSVKRVQGGTATNRGTKGGRPA